MSAPGQIRLAFPESPWVISRDGDPDCKAIHDRHYSARRYRDGRDPAKFVGPGEYLVLVTPKLDALLAALERRGWDVVGIVELYPHILPHQVGDALDLERQLDRNNLWAFAPSGCNPPCGGFNGRDQSAK